MEKIGEIFISHTHSDAEIASALSDAITTIFGGLITTSYSTKKELDGGIKPGEEWFRWIVDRVRASDIAVILLTPASTQKPWVLWEAGAVYGAGIASSDENARKVRPLVFKLSGDQVPSPFTGIQGVRGDEKSGITQFLDDLLNEFSSKMSPDQILRAGKKLDATIDQYLEKIKKALLNAPLFPTEASVQEWCDRIDHLVESNRLSEVANIHEWLNLTFGRDSKDQPIPIDLRLHRRLGDAYLASNRPDRAVSEYSLALVLSPRDIFLLRKLGTAYLDGNRLDEAANTLKRIMELDEDAAERNVECATFKARLQRKQNNYEGAAETYKKALDMNPDSYYLADVLGQTLLQLGRIDESRSVYRRAVDIIGRLSEQNVWTHATLVTSALVLDDEQKATRHLDEIAAMNPSPDVLKRIEEGMERIYKSLQNSNINLEALRNHLKK